MSANEVLVTVVGLLLGYWLVSYVLLALGGKGKGAPSPAAEADRQSTEADRQTAEADRRIAEADRPTAEADRPTAEADRQTAEADRQTTAARDDDRPPWNR